MIAISLIVQFSLSNAFQKHCLLIFSSQGSKKGRKGKYNYAKHYETRKTKMQELNNKRSLQRSMLKRSSVGVQERARRRVVSYGPPAFQVNAYTYAALFFLGGLLVMMVLDRLPMDT